MEYEIGKVGRIIVARGFDGEDVYKNIEAIAVKEGVNSAAVMVLGGLRRAKVVCGPKDPAGPLEAIWEQFDDAREIAGVGTIFCDDDQPRLHLHGAIGRGKSAIAGCPRGGANVFMLLEVVIIEIEGLSARRALDGDTGLKILKLFAGKTVGG